MGEIINIGSMRPANNRVAVFGHSKMDYHTTISGASFQQLTRQSTGALNWAAYLSKQRFDFEPAWDFGLAGDWTGFINWGGTDRPGMVNRIDAALAATDAATFLMQLTTNDRQSWDADTTIANVAIIVDKVRKAGRVLILMTDDPRGDTANTATRLASPQLEYAAKVNDYIRSLHGVGRVIVVDTWPLLSNKASATGDIIANMTFDGLHPNANGAYYVGMLIARVMDQLFAPRWILPNANISVRNATYNPDGLGSSNPYLTGTAGTLPTGGSGTLPTGWNMGSTNFTTYGLSVAYAAVTTTAFNGKSYADLGEAISKDWTEVTITGTVINSGNAEIPLLEQQFSAFTAGDIVRGVAEIEVDSTIGFPCFSLVYWDSQTGRLTDLFTPSEARSAVWAGGGHTGVLRTPKGLAMGNSNRIGIRAIPQNGVVANAKFRVRGIGVGKALAA